MNNDSGIEQNILESLAKYAEKQGCTVNQLLNQWLGNSAPIHVAQPLLHRQLLNAVGQAIIATDLDGTVVFWNDAAEKLYGWSSEETIGKDIVNFTPTAFSREQASEIMAHLRKGVTWEGEFQVQHKNGRTFSAHVSDHPIYDETGKLTGIVGVSFDITERKKFEVTLQESEERYRTITELMTDFAICVRVNLDGTTVREWTIGAYEDITGFERGKTGEVLSIDPIIHPDDKERVEQELQRTLDGEKTISEYRRIHKTGSYIWIRVDRQPVWSEEEGRVVRFYAVVTDITARKNAEAIRIDQERLKLTLKRERDMNSLIKLTFYNLRHDIGKSLQIISSSAELLSQQLNSFSDERQIEKFERILRQIQVSRNLLDDTVKMAGSNLLENEFAPTETYLPTLCKVCLNDVQGEHSKNHKMEFVNVGHVRQAYVDEILVTRILLNLLWNAVKFSPDGGVIRLELDSDDNWIILRVIDHGIGIHPDKLPYIFEPFYRAEESEYIEGTGLGLSIVYDCVMRHKGHVHAESESGKGATFIVKLPRQLRQNKQAPENQSTLADTT